MKITEVRIHLKDARPSSVARRLKAFASVTFDDEFVVRDIKIVQGGHSLIVAMPNRKVHDHCARCAAKNTLSARYCNACGIRLVADRVVVDRGGHPISHKDVAHPINQETRERIQGAVIDAYYREVGRSTTQSTPTK
jgi:stage V sporulation protein G